MSNRKESLKKSLGLTEYPWSSDDEDNPQSNPEPAPSVSRRPPDSHTSHHSGPSGAGTSAPSMSPTRRNQTRLERDLFWSLLNNPNRMSAPGPSRAYESTGERVDLNNPVTNIQRILAIKRLTRNLGTNMCRHPEYGTSRNIIFSPMQSDMATALKISRIRRRPSSRAPLPCTRSSIIPAVIDASSASAASARASQMPEREQNSDEEPPRSMSPENENNDDNAEEQENADMDTSGEGASLEEDIEEVDGGGAEPREAEDEDAPAQPEQDAEADTREEPPAENPTTALAQISQSVKRKRDSHGEAEPESVKDFNQSLLRLLECPVCLEVMEPPMSQCRRGHLVCGRCRARLAACPVCRTPFSSVRNRAMEAVSEMLRYPCRHGCGRDARLRRRAAHEASCAARRYRCPAPACAERAPVPLADLPLHFQSEHLSMLKVGRRHKFSMKVNTEQHDHWLVMAARELFHLRVDVDIRTWGVVVYVAYIGPKCNANNFTYKVTVTGQQNNRKLAYTRATHSDLESTSLNVSRQDCFHLTLDQAANFLRLQNRYSEPDKYLDFVVEIKKRDVPAENALDESGS
ncbi:unnamed protein product, partial [Brenthis ino]